MPKVLRTLGFDADYVRAEGAYLFDRDGRRYLDFLSGFGVFALGRCHPGIEQALRDAMDLSLPNLVQMECAPLSGLLAEALVARMPNDGYRCFFTNSGAESVETAMKYARCATGRGRILFADHAFHGLTMGALSLNGAHEFRDRFGTLLPGCQSVPFGDLDALERELTRRRRRRATSSNRSRARACSSHPRATCAPRPSSVTATARCSRSTRCRPDSAAPARSSRSSSGTSSPISSPSRRRCPAATCPSARSSRRPTIVERVFDKMDRAVVHSSTFGQNVLAMTAGLATLHTIDAESIVERASSIGAQLMSGLEGVAKRHELVHEVRGRGLMIGIEFSRPRSMRLRAQWTLLESMRSGLFTQMVIVPLFRDHGILSSGRGRPPERAQDPAAAHHDRGAGRGVRRRDRRGARRARTLARAVVGRRQFARAARTPRPALSFLIPPPEGRRHGSR